MAYQDELDKFMWAISKQESGHNYGAVGPQTKTYGKALGRYQIMSAIWPGWAAEAGIPGADWQNPDNQEKVARHKMTEYYQRYGSWDLVAIAWFAGPGRANTAAREGIDAVGGISDVLGTDVRTYVDTAMGSMGQAGAGREEGGGRTEGTGTTSPMATPDTTAGHATGGQPAPQDPNKRRLREAQLNQGTMESIMSSISQAATSGGGRLLDVKEMFGDAFGEALEEVA